MVHDCKQLRRHLRVAMNRLAVVLIVRAGIRSANAR